MMFQHELVSIALLDYKERVLLKVNNRDEGHLNKKVRVELEPGEHLVAAQVWTTGFIPVRIMLTFY